MNTLRSWQTVGLAGILSFRLFGQAESRPMAFEVASVRAHQGSAIRSGRLQASSPLIRLQGYTVFGLVMDAWNVRDYQLSVGGGVHPADMFETMYDIAAKAPGQGVPRVDDVRAMLRSLLIERFGLRVRRETKEMPVYALVTGKNATTLKRSVTDAPCTVRTRLAADGRNDESTFTGCALEDLANHLTNLMHDRPVVERTGLTGRYDFQLVAIPEYRTHGQADDSRDISGMAAVGKLGLRLQGEKDQVEIIAVEHVEKATEN